MSDDEEEDDVLQGLARPNLGMAGPALGDEEDSEEEGGEAEESSGPPATTAKPLEDESDGEDEDEDAPEGLVSARAAFQLDTAPDALELDPFRVAPGMDVPAASSAQLAPKAKKGNGGAAIPRKLFVGGLAPGVTDAALFKFFARFGKVQEAHVPGGRGFGFVTFVSDKGARYCLQQAGDPPALDFDGRECSVRYAETKDDHGARLHKMPARGNVDYLGYGKKRQGNGVAAVGGSRAASSDGPGGSSGLGDPGIAMIAQAHKRALPEGAGAAASNDPPGARGGGEGRGKRKKKEIVTVSKRQDAEPLDKRPITMKEIFPKEFWRI